MSKTTLKIAEGTKKIGTILAEIEEIIIPDGVTSIGSFAFWDCISLASVTIGNSVEFIGECAFYNCPSLEFVTIGNSVTSIDKGAFFGCSSLKAIYINKDEGSLDLSKACIPNTTKVYWRGEFEEAEK